MEVTGNRHGGFRSRDDGDTVGGLLLIELDTKQ
jgi:hypothetical protein